MEDIKLATDFWVIGINYRKADTEVRGKYAVSDQQYEAILNSSSSSGISGLFVLSTCNRTELYGIAAGSQPLIDILCQHTEGNRSDFEKQAYCKNGKEALEHLFHVAAGLDSQILGDYEIVSQIKRAFSFSRERGLTNAFLDRLFNTVLQSSRSVRSGTELSSGTVSVAFAAVQFLKTRISDLGGAKILIVGSGEIGQNACRSLVAIAGPGNITLTNRTAEKADTLAAELGLKTAPFDQLKKHIAASDVIIVATTATKPLIGIADFDSNDNKILIDLSIPNNIEAAVQLYKGIVLANVDDLSRINDETLRKRQSEIPKAKHLIAAHVKDFAEWHMMRRHVPVLKAVKEKLSTLNVYLPDSASAKSDDAVQKALNTMAQKMRAEEQRPGCSYIETIHHYLAGNAV